LKKIKQTISFAVVLRDEQVPHVIVSKDGKLELVSVD
jgi:hypothetical protein